MNVNIVEFMNKMAIFISPSLKTRFVVEFKEELAVSFLHHGVKPIDKRDQAPNVLLLYRLGHVFRQETFFCVYVIEPGCGLFKDHLYCKQINVICTNVQTGI